MGSVWFPGGTQQAIAVSKKNKCLLIVFIHSEDELTAGMEEIWGNVEVVKMIKDNHAVCLRLKFDSVPGHQFGSIYPVEVVPSTYFIGLNGRPVQIIAGEFTLETLVDKLDSSFQAHKEKLAAMGASSSNPNRSSGVSSPAGSGGASPPPGDASGASETASGGVSALPLQSRLTRAQELLEQKRLEDEQNAIEEEKEKERQRREAGKRLLELKQTAEDREMKEVAANRKKQKQLDREALQRVRDQIAADRQVKNEKFNQEKTEEVEKVAEAKAKMALKTAQQTEAETAERNKYSRLQFRCPGRPHFVQSFGSEQTLQEVYDFVAETSSLLEFKLLQVYPRREFTVDNLNSTLADLELVPSAILMIVPYQDSRRSPSGGGGAVATTSLFSVSGFMALVSAPFTFLYNMISSVFFGAHIGPASSVPESSSSGSARATTQDRNKSGGPSGGRVTMQGNQARLRNTQDDTDDGATWNGNSTQQL